MLALLIECYEISSVLVELNSGSALQDMDGDVSLDQLS